MRTSQAKSYSPGITPITPVFAERPTCPPSGAQCSWSFSVAMGKFALKYINSSCLEHNRLAAVQNGMRINMAA